MIEFIQIENIALIDHLKVPFKKGLNVLTGETGSGKSVIFRSLLLSLGDKFDFSFKKDKNKSSSIIVQFNIDEKDFAFFKKYLEGYGIELEETLLIIKRVFRIDKKIRNYINNQPVLTHFLKEISVYLLDFLSQHSGQKLLKKKNHQIFLDQFASLEGELKAFKQLYHQFLKEKRQLTETIKNRENEKTKYEDRKDLLTKIKSLNMKEKEDEYLENQIKKYTDYENIFRILESSYNNIYSKKDSLLSNIEKLMKDFEYLCSYDETWNDSYKDLKNAFFSLQNIHENLREYRASFFYSEDILDQLHIRLSEINNFKKKSGLRLEDIPQFQEEAEKKNAVFENYDKNLEEKKSKLLKQKEIIQEKALQISEKRKLAAKDLKGKIENEFSYLGMQGNHFAVSFKDFLSTKEEQEDSLELSQKIQENGMDDIEFLFSSSDEKDLKAFHKIASGGELSRVMLSIKSILVEKDRNAVLILDEVDSGIGGNIALSLAKKIHEISQSRQVICITHLPQIAIQADHHIWIEKKKTDNKIEIQHEVLSHEKKINEIARMLSGRITDKSILHAKELLIKK